MSEVGTPRDRLPMRLGADDAPRPPGPVQLVALDLDGTTLDSDQRCHPRTQAAVQATVARGIHVVAATSRGYRSALPWARFLGLRAPLICYQGALVRALPEAGAPLLAGIPQGRLIAEYGLDAQACARALTVAARGGWHVQGYRDDRVLCDRTGPATDYYARLLQVEYELVDDLATALAEGSTTLVCVVLEEAGSVACESAMRAALGASARVVRCNREVVEITNPLASKGRALRRVCELLGVTLTEVVAAGDSANDADMLAAAGFAVTVEGGDPQAIAAADALIPGPGDAGVAILLETLGLV